MWIVEAGSAYAHMLAINALGASWNGNHFGCVDVIIFDHHNASKYFASTVIVNVCGDFREFLQNQSMQQKTHNYFDSTQFEIFRNGSYFPMASANGCGNSYACFLSLSIGAFSIGALNCIGLYDISQSVASADFAAAFLANFFDGPEHFRVDCSFIDGITMGVTNKS